jgi:hypothetical protein
MPIQTQGAQVSTPGGSSGGWWNKFTEGVKSSNFTFTSGPQGWSFGGIGGGTNALPTPPSGQDVNSWLPYVIGGAVILKLLK